MAALKVAGSCQIMWRFVAGMLALFCAIGLARSGYGQVDQVGELISELKYSDPGVRLNAVQALARIGDGRVTEPLIASLSDTDPEVRESAAFGLGGIRDLKAVEPLIVSLKDSDGRDLLALSLIHISRARSGAGNQRATTMEVLGNAPASPTPKRSRVTSKEK